MRFSTILVTYFVVGAVMWGGGAIAWTDSGLGQFLIDDPTSGEANEEVSQEIEQSGGPIQQAASTIGGAGLLAVWNLLVRFVAYLAWPVATLYSVNAPPRVIVAVGGSLVMVFLATLIRILRSSA